MSQLTKEGAKLMSDYRKAWKFKLYVWRNLPSLGFWKLRVTSIEEDHCSMLIPFKWRSQNPFKSIYFSALAGAAEISTGALVQCYLAGRGRYSMLVIDFKMSFVKKAITDVVFTSTEGYRIEDIVIEADKTGEGQKFDLHTTGVNTNGEVVATAIVTWSIKKKSSQQLVQKQA